MLGTSDFAIACARGLRDAGMQLVAMVSVPEELRPDNSADIAAFAETVGAAYIEVSDINSPDSVAALRAYSPDFLFVSWPRILGPDALAVPRYSCIGTHPTALPANRGRHPLHWILVLGIQETRLSFIRLDKSVDTGDILLQAPLPVNESDGIQDLTQRMVETGYEGTMRLCEMLTDDPTMHGVPQRQEAGNTWRKRTPHDVTLDLRMSAGAIVRTVRSFAPPYPCAILRFNEHEVRIKSAWVIDHPSAPDWSKELRQMEPGNVVSAEGRVITVKVEDAIVELEAVDSLPERLLRAKYVHPPTKYLCGQSIVDGRR